MRNSLPMSLRDPKPTFWLLSSESQGSPGAQGYFAGLRNVAPTSLCTLPRLCGLSESEVAQSCPTLCDPMDCNLPGSSIHEILQARILEVGCHFLLQGIFLNQGLNPGPPHCGQTL